MSAEVKVGSSLDLYRGKLTLENKRGHGAMATVYAATLESPGGDVENVAIKIFRPGYVHQAYLEATVLELLQQKQQHPNIVPFLWHEGVGENRIIGMQLAKPGTFVRDVHNRLTPAQIDEAFGAISEGLEYAHNQNVIHRDLKPANILRVDGGRLWVADWNAACIGIPPAGQDPVGTPEYIAPERLVGAPYTNASDQYSVGVMLYQAATAGESPYRPIGNTGVVLAAIGGAVRPFSDTIRTDSRLRAMRPFEPIARRAMAKQIDKRYPDMIAFAEDVRNAAVNGTQDAAVGRTRIGGINWTTKQEL